MTERHIKMLAELNEFYDFTIIEKSGDIEETREMLEKTRVYLARCNKIWADAQYDVLKEKEEHLRNLQIEALVDIKPSVIKEVLSAKSADAEYICKLAERISRTLVHSADILRSDLSYNKEEMKLSRTGY